MKNFWSHVIERSGGILCVAAIATAILAFVPTSAFAATLFVSPASLNVTAGQTFTVTIRVSSADQAMNTASADLAFPTNLLRVISIDKTNSVLTLWVQDPSFSNSDSTGDANFAGVALNPGFTGESGTAVTIAFRAVGAGTGQISFNTGAVLANDGTGTNILNGMTGATVTVSPAPAGAPAPINANTSGIAVTSNPPIGNNTWYAINGIQFNWRMPGGADGVWYTLSSSSNMAPPASAVAENNTQAFYDLSSLQDGVWYFLISAEEGGAWTPVTVKTLQIDRTAPQPFTITRTDTDPTDAQPIFTWATGDGLSGISHTEIKIGDGDWFDAATIQQGSSYVLPTQAPESNRTLTVDVFDNAGNVREETTTFTVVSPQSWQAWWYRMIHFFSLAEILLTILVVILMIGAYIFIAHLLAWKRNVKKTLRSFEERLRKDTDSATPTSRIIDETKQEIEEIEKMDGRG